MDDRKWGLGEDLIDEDHILDPISFYDIILMLHCNEKVIDKAAVKRCFREVLESRMEDAMFLLEKNTDEMIRRAKIGRGEYEEE